MYTINKHIFKRGMIKNGTLKLMLREYFAIQLATFSFIPICTLHIVECCSFNNVGLFNCLFYYNAFL